MTPAVVAFWRGWGADVSYCHERTMSKAGLRGRFSQPYARWHLSLCVGTVDTHARR